LQHGPASNTTIYEGKNNKIMSYFDQNGIVRTLIEESQPTSLGLLMIVNDIAALFESIVHK
jgi:hypothetical protein